MQGLIAGCTNYSEQTIDDIKNDIVKWQRMSQEISEIFTSTIIELKNNGYWQETVPFNFRIFCENVPNICRTFISDFKKILDDIEQGKILKTTIKLMENIYRVSVENEERSWKTFKDDHDWHVYSNKNFQAAEKLYKDGRDFFVTLRDVSNATARMEDYTVEEKNSIIDNSITIGDGNKINDSAIGHNHQGYKEKRDSWWAKWWKLIIIPIVVTVVGGIIVGVVLYKLGLV